MENTKSKISLIVAMLIFSSIGIFRKYIPLDSGIIACVRGFVGALFLILLTFATKRKPDFAAIRKNALMLCVSGAFIGFNWILLFESYNYTSVAVATLCYYMAPVFVILASPFLFGERLSLKNIICVVGAIAGMILVSGILNEDKINFSEMKGILLGLGAAVLYACVVLINKKIDGIGAEDKTTVQLLSAAIVLVPYVFAFEGMPEPETLTTTVLILLALVGVVHTGFAYALYFGSMKNIKAQTVALFSYVDPVGAIILSALILNESMNMITLVGTVMVLGFTLFNELTE